MKTSDKKVVEKKFSGRGVPGKETFWNKESAFSEYILFPYLFSFPLSICISFPYMSFLRIYLFSIYISFL